VVRALTIKQKATNSQLSVRLLQVWVAIIHNTIQIIGKFRVQVYFCVHPVVAKQPNAYNLSLLTQGANA